MEYLIFRWHFVIHYLRYLISIVIFGPPIVQYSEVISINRRIKQKQQYWF